MRRSIFMVTFLVLFGLSTKVSAHFQLLIPSDDIVSIKDQKVVDFKLIFSHPMEGGPNMDMERPKAFGVFVNGEKRDLTSTLKPLKVPMFYPWNPEYKRYRRKKVTAWRAVYRIKRPGDHQFYVIPHPYFEKSEEKFIWQITKVCVNAFGNESGWDKALGLRAEIIPLTRPYGIWEGNTFRGLVLMDGKPAKNLEVEVEFYNKSGKVHPSEDCLVTQVVKTDENGTFVYTIPWAGWWGFSALGYGGEMMYKGKRYPVEMDAVIWVKVYPIPKGVK